MRAGLAVSSGAILAVALLIAWMNWWPHDERTEMMLHQPYGRVTSGAKFGIRIGETWGEADATIRRQFVPRYVSWEALKQDADARTISVPAQQPILSGDASVAYDDSTWRNGVITLDLMDGRVTRVTWHYPGPFYFYL